MTPTAENTVFLTLAGSQAHGTARDGSDVDVRGMCVAPLQLRLSPFECFEQFEGILPEALMVLVKPQLEDHATANAAMSVKTECVVFDVAKFVRLCATANPNALEILFADQQDWLWSSTAWDTIHSRRYKFLTRAVQHTFTGYAMAQLKKIKTHRSWLLNPPKQKPARNDFGLPSSNGTLSRDDQNRLEQAIADKVRTYGIDTVEMSKATRVTLGERIHELYADAMSCGVEDLEARLRAVATHALQVPTEVVAALNAEKKYRAAMKRWDAFQTWKTNRNPARAALELEHGYDTKHAMHLIRLMRMGVEAMSEGELRVRRTDAAELNEIRNGKLGYDELILEAGRLQDRMLDASSSSRLPDKIDQHEVDSMVYQLASHAR